MLKWQEKMYEDLWELTSVGERVLHRQEVPSSTAGSTLMSPFRSPLGIRKIWYRIEIHDAQSMVSHVKDFSGLAPITR